MKKNKTEQAIIEFFMTYGWAIILLLFSIGFLYYLGSISPDNLIPKQQITEDCCNRLCNELPGNFSCISFNNERVKTIECKDVSGRADTGLYSVSHLFEIKNTTLLCSNFEVSKSKFRG